MTSRNYIILKTIAKGKLKATRVSGLSEIHVNFVVELVMHACLVQWIGQVFWMNVNAVSKLGSLDMNSPSQNMIQVVL